MNLVATREQLEFSATIHPGILDEKLEIQYFLNGDISILCTLPFQDKSYYVELFYPAAYLARFEDTHQKFSHSFKHFSNVFTAESTLCCLLRDDIHSLVQHQYTGIQKNIFIESKALLLLLHVHDQCEHKQEALCFNCKFLNIPSEQQKILQSRVILMINLSEPPTIPALAKAVHINECYLKKGFKEMFGCSIFDFVQQERIKKAKQLLVEKKLSVQQIALELGYSNTSNFTNAYKRITGYAPSEWLKIIQ